MSSTLRTNHQYKHIHQKSRSRSNQTKKVDHAKQSSFHQPLPSPLPDEEFHHPHEAAAKKHSDLENISPRRFAKTESAKKQSSSAVRNGDHHVIRTKAATAPRLKHRTPHRRSTCLEHMSAVNCTADCFNPEPLAGAITPPAAPLPPRLPTPDLSDADEDAFWSCCRPSESSRCSNISNCKTESNDDEVGLWNDMEEKLTQAISWQKKGRKTPRATAFE